MKKRLTAVMIIILASWGAVSPRAESPDINQVAFDVYEDGEYCEGFAHEMPCYVSCFEGTENHCE